MYVASVIYVSITVVLGSAFAGESKDTVKHLEPTEGSAGYDLFYYDGESLRDEKWRFDPKTGSTVVSRRSGFRDKDNFHLVDSTLDSLGSFTKSYRMKNEKELIKQRVREPQMNKERDNIRTGATNAFSGVTINTQYSTHNEYPRVPNIVGIQQLNTPNLYQSLNFQQAFSGFGFQQLFNHQTQVPSNPLTIPPNNQYFQLPSSFLMPFFNQNNYSPNQHQTFVTGPVNHEQQNVISSIDATETLENTLEPIVDVETTTTTTTTTLDPTSSFDVRLEKDKNLKTNETVTQSIQTTSRRPIEGLPTSDEDDADEGGVLDDKINQQVLKTLVG